ncbi:MAG: glycosyltransferase family 9 protein [Pirellulales bacterium]
MSDADQVERLLIVRNDRMGDLILTLPTIELARQAFPAAEISLLVTGYTAPLVAGNSHLDRIIEDNPSDSCWTLARRLRAYRFDTALVINTNRRNCLAVWLAGVSTRVCWAYKPLSYLLGNRLVHRHRNRPPIHESEFALEFLRRLDVSASVSDTEPHVEIDPPDHQGVAARIARDLGEVGPLFGVHPGNGQSAYNWMPTQYIRLIERLARHGRVMVTGGGAEQRLLDRIRDALPGPALARVAFYSDFSLGELTAAIAMQDVMTASSTGPMHLAGLLQTPVVAIFSAHPAHSPVKWAPLGSNNVILVPPLAANEAADVGAEEGARQMARITVDRVIDANLLCLSRQGASRRPLDGSAANGRTGRRRSA